MGRWQCDREEGGGLSEIYYRNDFTRGFTVSNTCGSSSEAMPRPVGRMTGNLTGSSPATELRGVTSASARSPLTTHRDDLAPLQSDTVFFQTHAFNKIAVTVLYTPKHCPLKWPCYVYRDLFFASLVSTYLGEEESLQQKPQAHSREQCACAEGRSQLKPSEELHLPPNWLSATQKIRAELLSLINNAKTTAKDLICSVQLHISFKSFTTCLLRDLRSHYSCQWAQNSIEPEERRVCTWESSCFLKKSIFPLGSLHSSTKF
jgi:hypothetical protein